jgi:NAD(P)-dependent dehydrogenase (short-subunit alcohol dehydrogenase family)
MDATVLLRPGLLADRVVALGGGTALGPPLEALGARTVVLNDERAPADVEVLLHDLRPAFGDGGHDALRAALDAAWVAICAVANAAFIPSGRGGKVTLIAPPPAAEDPAAAAARAAAENLARTLSIEWARHAITTVALLPGSATTDAQLAALAAYLASPAGDYFSGCRLALGETYV